MTRQAAFTLIELIVTIVFIGIVLLALVTSLQESLKHMARQNDLRRAVVSGEDLMNEIRSKSFVDPANTNSFGRETNAPDEVVLGRRAYDDVDDYDTLSESPPKTIAGTNAPAMAGFTRRVVVANVSGTNFNGPALPTNSTDFKRITVVVSNAEAAVSNVSVVSRWD